MDFRDYQRDALAWLHRRPRSIYGDAPGTGKTAVTSMAVFDKRSLIVAPMDVVAQWQAQASLWAGLPVIVGTGTAVQRGRARQQFADQLGDWALAINYESFHIDLPHLLKLGFDTVVFDEAHRLNERSTLVFKAAAKIARRVKNLRLVTGTPILNNADELWALLHLLDPKAYASYWRWVRQHFHVEVTTFYGKLPQPVQLVGTVLDGHAELIRAEIEDQLLYRPLDLLLPDLPPVVENVIEVDLATEERRAYDELKRRYWTRVGEEVIYSPNEVAKITRLRQMASDWSAFQPERGTKVRRAVELVNEDLPDQQHVVLAAFKETAHRLHEELGGLIITGEQKRPERARAIEAFRAGDERVLVGTLHPLREGVDGLQVAHHLTLLDRDWTPARHDQVIARVRRPGQESPQVYLHQIVARDTTDQLVAQVAHDKRAVIDAILSPLSERTI